MKKTLLYFLCCIVTTNTYALEAEPYQPILLKEVKPQFPNTIAFKDSAGYVEFSYMVNDQGEVLEPAILVSTNSMLNKNALKAIKKMSYEPFPEQYAGSIFRAKKTLYFQNPKIRFGYTPLINKSQRKVKTMLSNSSASQEKILASLLRAKNKHVRLDIKRYGLQAYANALVKTGIVTQHLLEFEYAVRFGTSSEQIKSLELAAAYFDLMNEELDEAHKAVFNTVFSSLFILYVNEKRYADSLHAYKMLNSLGTDTTQMTATVSQILALKSDERRFEMHVDTNENGVALYNPLKKNITLTSASSNLSEAKLRCERHFSRIDSLQLQQTVEMPKAWGQCLIEFTGKPDSTIKLIEH